MVGKLRNFPTKIAVFHRKRRITHLDMIWVQNLFRASQYFKLLRICRRTSKFLQQIYDNFICVLLSSIKKKKTNTIEVVDKFVHEHSVSLRFFIRT